MSDPCTVIIVAATTRVPTLQTTLMPGAHVFAGDIRGQLRHNLCRPPHMRVVFGNTAAEAVGQVSQELNRKVTVAQELADYWSDICLEHAQKRDVMSERVAELAEIISGSAHGSVTPEEFAEHTRNSIEHTTARQQANVLSADLAHANSSYKAAQLQVVGARRQLLDLLKKTAHLTGVPADEDDDELLAIDLETTDADEMGSEPAAPDGESEPHTDRSECQSPIDPLVEDTGEPDDLTLLRSIGAGRQKTLNAAKITTFRQVARMDPMVLTALLDGKITDEHAAEIIADACARPYAPVVTDGAQDA